MQLFRSRFLHFREQMRSVSVNKHEYCQGVQWGKDFSSISSSARDDRDTAGLSLEPPPPCSPPPPPPVGDENSNWNSILNVCLIHAYLFAGGGMFSVFSVCLQDVRCVRWGGGVRFVIGLKKVSHSGIPPLYVSWELPLYKYLIALWF